jgi:HK97 family phage major capsid protein
VTETGVPLDSLAGFATAIGDLLASNAQPGALVLNPVDLGTLLGVTESAESNVPLWKDAVAGAAGLRLPYFGTPLFVTPACPQGTGLMFDPRTVLVVVRKEADVAVDPYYGFDHGSVGLRVYTRATVVVGQPAGAVRLTFAA